METQRIDYAREVMSGYKADVKKLLSFTRYLEQLSSKSVMSSYTDQGIGQHSIPIPVFDSQLLSFIKTAQRSCLINRNFPYIYSRYGIKNHEDEEKLIEKATYKEMDVLKGILTYYVEKGNINGTYWIDAVRNGMFCKVVRKMDALVEMWKLE